jgi:dipeptidyl aminopeptidase/acylaminoacyl peptidase
MPWEGARLCLGRIHDTEGALPRVSEIETLAGSHTVGIFQPTFSPDGRFLAYISNQSGWGQLYLYDVQERTHRVLTTAPAECGQPAWAQGMRTYGFHHNSQGLYYAQNTQGFRHLWYYDVQRHSTAPCEIGLTAYTWFDQPAVSPTCTTLACIASSPTLPPRIVTVALDTPASPRICRRSTSEHVPVAALSTPQALTWPTAGSALVHGLFYPPRSTDFHGTGRPPAILHIHGGPTAQAVAGFQAQTQFFTTRGYAVLQVNYRGSTGYGTAYVEALRGQWGIADVEDAVSGAHYLVDQGLASAQHLVIMGGSAGGYTVLQALVQHPGFFKAALCLYGISNLFTLAATTHKFEAHYLDSLIGPLPEAAALYRERSPLFAADRICDPIALFQGDVDQVVPKVQAEAMVASLARRGVPHEYHVYAGEGHGWRKAETIAHFYTTVEAFLRQYVLFA